MKTVFALLALILLASPARAESSEMTQLASGVVADVLRSDIIQLADSKRFRLDNVLIPTDSEAATVAALKSRLIGKKVALYTYHPENERVDRYGLPLVQVMMADDGAWMQAEMVSKGLAWAYSTLQSRQMFDTLLPMEKDARKQKLGFWANPVYDVKTPENVGQFLNSFQVVEGKVLNVASTDETTYLNFGEDWKTDFTITLARSDWEVFTETYFSFTPAVWKDRKVTIRGWVEDKNGPMIRLTHPEQIQSEGPRIRRVGDPAPAKAAPVRRVQREE